MTQTDERITATIEGTVLHSAPEIAGGSPVFIGTQVPVRTLFGRLSNDEGLDAFLESFPTVGRDQAVRAIHMARAMLEAYAYGDARRLDALCTGGSPGVSSTGQAPAPLGTSVIHRDAAIVWGTPVFKGSRMPMRNLFDYLADGYTITGFLECFDTAVTPEQAGKAIDMAGQALESYAHATAVG